MEFAMTTTEDLPTITVDGRTKLGWMLSTYDELYEVKTVLRKELETADQQLTALVDEIKLEAAKNGIADANLDSTKLAYVLRLRTTPQRRMTEADLKRFRADHPNLWLAYSTEKVVHTLRRLTGAQWRKPKAGA
jgi:hypothetical protein